MEKISFEDGIFQIYCSELITEDSFEIIITNTIQAIESYDKSSHGQFLRLKFINSIGEEVDFWDKITDSESTYPLAKKYLEYCISYLNKSPYIYEDDETPFCGKVAYELSMADREFVPYYSRLLHIWDMGHEVNEITYISDIVYQHEWCKEIEGLIIARVTDRGQHGFEQLKEFEDFIRENNEPLLESEFFKELVNILGESDWFEDFDNCSFVFGGMAEEAMEMLKKIDDEFKKMTGAHRFLPS